MSAGLTDLARRFSRAKEGVAALEFALISPLLLVLFVTASGIASGVTADRKLRNTASTTADLLAQVSSVSKAEIQATMKIATAVMAPLDADATKIVVSSITIDGKGAAKVDWSEAVNGGTALRPGQPATLPASFGQHRSRSLLMVEASYTYKPLLIYELQTSYDMKEVAYLSPRIAMNALPCTDCTVE